MLEIKNLTCGYEKKIVLENISFKVKKGDILSILGANGVGKTTLFKTMLGLLDKKSGDVFIDNKNILDMSNKDFAKLVAYVPQAHIPPFPYKVIDVVVMGKSPHLNMFESPSKKDYLDSEEILDSLNIYHLKDKSYTEISGGERQLVLIARALSQKPKFLVMDEPTSNLDYGNQIKVLNKIRKLSKNNIGIIMTTHFPNHALMASNKSLIIKDKSKYKFGLTSEVLDSDSLKDIYGIDIKIENIKLDKKSIKVCLPLI